MSLDERVAAIGQRLHELLGARPEDLRQLSSGASRETWAFTSPAHGALIAQLDGRREGEDERPPQAPVLAAAAAAGVPVPQVIASGRSDTVLGPSWVVVEALPGTTDPVAIVAGHGVPAESALLDSIASALAAVHRMPADPALVPSTDDPVGAVRALHDALGQPHPVFELAFRELARARPTSGETPRFVHGDFRVGNLMVGPDGVTGVLDWELAHLGDPVADLGWLCVPAWRFTRPDRPAAGIGTREELLDAYARHAAVRVDPEALRWWELWGTLRWGVFCVSQAFLHLSGSRESLEHAVIGRRASEVEWDLLEMLDPDPDPDPDPGLEPEPEPDPGSEPEPKPDPKRYPDPDSSPPPPDRAPSAHPGLHDRPTVDELLGAARGALGDDVLPYVSGRAAFQVRVALRTLGIVRRELAGAIADGHLHAATLAEFGVTDNAELARAIRDGDLAGREAELYPALRAIVRAKLRVANPRYVNEEMLL